MPSLCFIGLFNSDSAHVIHPCTESGQQFLEQNSYYGEVVHEEIKLIWHNLALHWDSLCLCIQDMVNPASTQADYRELQIDSRQGEKYYTG